MGVLWVGKGLNHEPHLIAFNFVIGAQLINQIKYIVGDIFKGGNIVYCVSYISYLLNAMRQCALLVPVYQLYWRSKVLNKSQRRILKRVSV